ncbi:MAG: energy transducer TonB, partial [Ginsengibacter sp.]
PPKYYTSNWLETTKDKAVFYADFLKDGANYKCTSYWINTSTVRGKSTYADTTMLHPVGLQGLYFKNGHVEDSSFFEDDKLKYSFHYYPNNQLAAHYYSSENNKEGITEGYDDSGRKIKNYVFQKEAEFKGGQKAWASYIIKNAPTDLTVKGITEPVSVSVNVQFIVDENGYVIMPKIIKSSGYKNVDNDAVQIIANSPTWKNAIQYNNPVKAYRVQPLTFEVRPEKK